MAQAGPKSQPWTSKVGKMVLNAEDGRRRQSRCLASGGWQGTWHFRGEWEALGSIWRRKKGKSNISLSSPQSIFFLSHPVI